MRFPALLAAFVAGTAACSRPPSLDTRTFDLHYLDPGTVEAMIRPYVFTDRTAAPGTFSTSARTLTVRETPDNLERIARVLAEHDRPQPWVRLRFQLIAADGAAPPDPRIADVQAELVKLFRFAGYRLLGEAVASGAPRSSIHQVVGGEGGPYSIGVNIGDVRSIGDTGIVSMQVTLRSEAGAALTTEINARESQTLVLGNAQLALKQGTTILTVRAEIVRQ